LVLSLSNPKFISLAFSVPPLYQFIKIQSLHNITVIQNAKTMNADNYHLFISAAIQCMRIIQI